MTVFASARSERYLFEAWCNAPGLVAFPLLPGTATYASPSLQKSWGAWQARAALLPARSTLEPAFRSVESTNFMALCSLIDGQAWIRVEDRLPELAVPVLAVIAGKRNDQSRVSIATHWQLGKGFSGTDPEWMEGTDAFISARVTHWMPLTLPQVHETAIEANK